MSVCTFTIYIASDNSTRACKPLIIITEKAQRNFSPILRPRKAVYIRFPSAV